MKKVGTMNWPYRESHENTWLFISWPVTHALIPLRCISSPIHGEAFSTNVITWCSSFIIRSNISASLSISVSFCPVDDMPQRMPAEWISIFMSYFTRKVSIHWDLWVMMFRARLGSIFLIRINLCVFVNSNWEVLAGKKSAGRPYVGYNNPFMRHIPPLEFILNFEHYAIIRALSTPCKWWSFIYLIWRKYAAAKEENSMSLKYEGLFIKLFYCA